LNAQLRPPPFVPGIRPHVPFETYQAMEGLNASLLKEMRHSPRMFRYRRQNPKTTKSMVFGTGGHCAVLEPDRFGSDFAVWDRRTDAGKSAPRTGQHWEAFQREHAGQTVLTADEHAKVMSLQMAVRGDRDAMRYLGRGEPEVSMQWLHNGRPCKARPDWLTRDWIDGNGERQTRPCLVGLKSSRDCRPFQFGRQAANLGYHLSWGYYYDGFKALTGEEPKVVEIVVDAEPPHCVVVYEVPDEVLQLGCEEYLALIEKLDECERTNTWPGPVSGEQPLVLPAYVYGEEEITYVE
jgi:hypothetical protein